MKKIFLWFLVPCLHASVNIPWRLEWETGYRNDRIHWHLQNPANGNLTYSEKYRDVQFWENALVFKTITRDIAFFFRGSYSALGKGTLHQKYSNTALTTSTDGWAADGNAYVSYAVNLTNGRLYKWILMPLLGYSGHFERLHRNGANFPEQLRQTWYGFCLGVGLLIQPVGRMEFQIGYTYHWLHTHFATQWIESGTLLDSLHINRAGSRGQTGWATFDYRFAHHWHFGLGAQIHYFSTKFLETSLKQNGVSIPQTFKLRWTPIDGWVQLSREL